MKNKLVYIILSVILVCAIGAVGYAIYSKESGKTTFAEDGYIIVYDEQNPQQAATTYHFTEGTSLKYVYPNSVVFKDVDGQTVTADANSFVHYDSGASASLSKSVLVDLDEVGSSAVNYYGMSTETPINKNGSNYSIPSQNGQIDLSNYLWKVGDNHYMMVSDLITVSFTDGSEYSFDDYVELLYQDGGMVCIINGDTMLRDASKNTYISTDTGISINAATQMIIQDGEVRMSLAQMTTDSDQVISVLPADQESLKIVIPEFNFTVIDGTNGETGADGVNGASGTDGSDGIDGTNGTAGTDGQIGIEGYDGDDGIAGQPGTSGRSGVNGVEGAEGYEGQMGAAGQMGASGAAGAAGAPGAAGVAGNPGQAGPSGGDGQEGNAGNPGAMGNSQEVFNPTDVLLDVPYVSWVNGPLGTYSAIKGEFRFLMNSGDTTNITIKDVKLELIDLTTGRAVYKEDFNDMDTGGNASTATFEFDNLTPSTAYRLKLSGTYDYKNRPVNTVFDDKTVYTDKFPLVVNVYSVTSDEIVMELINRDAGATESSPSTNYYTLSYELTKADGTSVKEQSGFMLSQTGSCKVNRDGSTSDYITFNSSLASALTSDTQYYFTVTELAEYIAGSSSIPGRSDIPSIYTDIPVKTLKKTPTIGDVSVDVNILNQSFDFSVKTVVDPDHGITQFRYDVMDANNNDEIVKSVYSSDSDICRCFVDGELLNANGEYKVRAVAEFFDNYKKVEIVADYPDKFTLNGVDKYTWFTLENKDAVLTANALGQSSNEAHFALHIPAGVNIKENSKLRISYHSDVTDGYSRYFEWETLKSQAGTGTAGEKVIPLYTYFNNLKSSTTYKFDCYGTVDMTGDNVYVDDKYLGTVIVTTPRYTPLSAGSSGQSSSTQPVSFKITLSQSVGDASVAPNNAEYAINQAGSASNYDTETGKLTEATPDTTTADTLRGSALVQLFTPGLGCIDDHGAVSRWDLVGEGYIPLKLDGNTATAEYITLDDFPGNLVPSNFNEKYKVHIVAAYDSTSHKNMIPVTCEDKILDLGKSYPEPASLSLQVTAIRKDNLANYLGGVAHVTNYDNYDPTTVIGYALKVNGLGKKLSYFDELTYYVYDDYIYNTQKQPIADKLRSNLPILGDGEKYSQISPGNIGATDQSGESYFYPETGSDTSYMAKITYTLKKSQGGGYDYMTDAPIAVFLFEDCSASAHTDDATNISNRNIQQASGFDAPVVVVNDDLYRGHKYDFTFRLHTNKDEMPDDKYYPEVLGDDKAGILKAERTYEAPFEAPTYYFYPFVNGDSSVEYGYYINTVDAAAAFADTAFHVSDSNWTVTYSSKDGTNSTGIAFNRDAKVNISGLAKKNRVEVSVNESLFLNNADYKYNEVKNKTVFTKFFTGKNSQPVGTYSIDNQEDMSRVYFQLKFRTPEEANSVTAIFAQFAEKGTTTWTTDKRLYILSVQGSDVTAYIRYSDLSQFVGTGKDVESKLTVYYDTGVEGITELTGTPAFYAIREAGADNVGPYITLDDSNSFVRGTVFEGVTSARDSLYRISSDNTKGAQAQNIAATLADTTVNNGMIDIRIWDPETNDWYYDTKMVASAKIGGAYAAPVTVSNNPFTISKVATTSIIYAGPSGSGEYGEFKLGKIIPQVNLHKGASYTITNNVNSASVEFEIAGVKGVKDAIYGYDTSATTPCYGKVYFLLYEAVDGGRIPVLDNGKQVRYEIPLTKTENPDSPGDGKYTKLVDGLQPETYYDFQIVFYNNEADYNNYENEEYMIDMMQPDRQADQIFYPIHTTVTIGIKEQDMKMSYVAESYSEKYIKFNYKLSSNMKATEELIYALYDKDGRLILSDTDIKSHITQGDGDSFTLECGPGRLPVGLNGDSTVYMDLENIKDYKLRFVPVSKTRNSYTGIKAKDADGRYTEAATEAYNDWINTCSLGQDSQGGAVYAEFSKIKLNIQSPFYNIEAYSKKNKVSFKVSVVDKSGVLVNNNYMIRVFDETGSDITPDTLKTQVYSTSTPCSVDVNTSGDSSTITLKLYGIEDKLNQTPDNTISYYSDSFITAEATYKKAEASEKSTGANGFSVGSLQAVYSGTIGRAWLDFVNPEGMSMIELIHVDVTDPSGVTSSLDEQERPFVGGDGSYKIVSGTDERYRWFPLQDYQFSASGTYTINIRMTVKDNSGHVTTEDRAVNYFVS